MAESATPVDAQALGSSGTSISAVVEVAFWLFIVLMIIFAAAWLLRRFGGAAFQGSGVIRVIAAVSVGGRDRVTLVDVGGQQILLGVSPGRINTLHVFDEPVVDTEGSGPGGPGSGNSDFARKLQTYISKGRSQ